MYYDTMEVFSTDDAFAIKLFDGRVVTCGSTCHGGDSSAVSAQLKGVETIVSTKSAFAAKLENGHVVTWGLAHTGGDSTSVQSQLKGSVYTIYSNGHAFYGSHSVHIISSNPVKPKQDLKQNFFWEEISKF